jgi:lipid-A-disaccharide synthase
MISCGEPSGDLYAGALVEEIRRREPSAQVFGLGGERLRAAGARLLGDYGGLTVTGLTEAIRVVPRSFAMYRRLLAAARQQRPDVLVAIDFPDFNLRLATSIKDLGIPVAYYVSPQLWAWRRGRIRRMKRVADRVLVIFPFEEAIYRQAGIPVEFVGHPLVDLARADLPRRELRLRYGLDPDAPTIALLPGSRPSEVRQILPRLHEAARLIAERLPRAQFILAKAPRLDDGLFVGLDLPFGARFILDSRADDVLAAADVALTASGTATIQAAMHGCPMVVVYCLSPWTYRLGKPFVHVDTYAMVNIVAGNKIVPELIQDDFTPRAVADEALGLLTNPTRAETTREALDRVRVKIGRPGASARAADAVLRIVYNGQQPV